jgi:hypothetical protein
MPQLGRNVPEVVKVNRLNSFGDFLMHGVVLQNRRFGGLRAPTRALTPWPASPYTLAS